MTYRFVTHEQVPDLSQQLADLSNLAFAEYEGAPEVDAGFIDWYLRRPGCAPYLCTAALSGEKLVANVLVALQPLNIGGEFIMCGIVDTVATDPEHRQQGLARRLMDMAHDLMSQSGAEAAVLYTNPANHPYQFYGRLGYETRAQAGMLTGDRPAGSGGYTIRAATTTETELIRHLVNEHYSTREGFARLDEALWQWHRVNRPANMPVQVLVAEHAAQIVGTVAFAPVEVLLEGQHQTVTVLSDMVYPHADCLRDLLAAAPPGRLMTLQALEAPERADLEHLGFITSVGEVAMARPLTARARELLRNSSMPWYVMVESVVGC